MPLFSLSIPNQNPSHGSELRVVGDDFVIGLGWNNMSAHTKLEALFARVESKAESEGVIKDHEAAAAPRPVLCDGAMGTMFYGGGVFINRCYDELNITQPETVRTVHEQYLQAGAQVIETNTFGANAYRLEHYGLREKVKDFNLAGAKIARQCVDALRESKVRRHLLRERLAPWACRWMNSKRQDWIKRVQPLLSRWLHWLKVVWTC